MLGPIVNAITIVICAVLGKLLIKNFPERFETIIKQGIALALIYIGIAGAMESNAILTLILSVVIGAILGEWIDIDQKMNNVGKWAEKKMGFREGNFAVGFVTASILFCTGSMAIVGSLNSGLQGNHEMLFAKSILDGVISIIFASQLGIGVAFAAIPVLLYQGAIALGATFIKVWLTAEIITEMSAVGSLLIAGIGMNFLGASKKEIKVANMIPAIFLPWIFIALGFSM